MPTGLIRCQTAKPAFRLLDHLGNEVGTLGSNGLLANPLDYTPFGQIFSGSTNDPYLFTGKERDAESGNDYFGARYFTSTVGRFLSPDWSAKAEPVPYAKLDDPQSLNLYAYVHNNPLSGVDADGHVSAAVPGECGYSEVQCRRDDGSDANVGMYQAGQGMIEEEAQHASRAAAGWPDDQSSTSTSQSQNTDYVSISYWPTGAKGFGHIGIGVDTDNTQGYSTADSKVHWWSRIFGAPAGGLEFDIGAHTSPSGEVAPHSYLHIPITADQAAHMQTAINARDPNHGGKGGHYNLIFNNCAQFVERVLHAGGVSGVPHAEVFGPAILGGILWAEH